MKKLEKTYVSEKYTHFKHFGGYYSIKDLLGTTIALVDFDEDLSFRGNPTDVVRNEVKQYCLENDISFTK